MKNKLAIFGGKKIRSKLMPKRFAFGKNEQNEINKMITFYKKKVKIQNIQDYGKKNFVLNSQNLWEMGRLMQ